MADSNTPDIPQQSPEQCNKQCDDCAICGNILLGTEACSCCGYWRLRNRFEDDENKDGATPSKKSKNVHSVAWAKEFVDKRANFGAMYDEKNHTIYCKFCRHMYLEQAETSTSGKFAFAKGIPDGWKWEDEIYAHFKEQVR